MSYKIFVFLLLGFLFHQQVSGQELNMRVTVQAGPAFQGDQTALRQLEQDLTRYINDRKWTEDEFMPEEKINGSVTLMIESRPSPDQFEGSLQILSLRPVYNSMYETSVLNFNDRDFSFKYLGQQALEFSENTHTSNLTSVINFYVFMMLGFDYDSFKLNGGDAWFRRAQNVANVAAPSREKGWNFTDGNRTRYWLLENMQNNTMKDIRKIIYEYHRKGLDVMAEDQEAGRKHILDQLKELQKFHKQNPQAYISRVFCDTKKLELVDIFKNAPDGEKAQMLTIMAEVDPSNLGFYNRVSK